MIASTIVYLEMDLKTLGYRIRKFRELKDLNQTQMAAKLKITASAYSKIERGITDPSVGRLDQIAAILKINIKDFFTDAPTQPTNGQLSLEQMDARMNELSEQLTILQKMVTQKKTAKR